MGLGAFKDQVTYVWASSRSPRHAYEQSCRPLSRARATLAKRGHPPWPVRRLGAFAQRGRALCASWTTCSQLFGLCSRKARDGSFHNACWTYVEEVAGIMDNVTAGLYRPQPFLSTVNGAWNAFLSSRNGLCQVDSLTAPPANATQREATRSRALRGKDQTADCTWPSKSTVCTASLRKSAEPAYWPRPAPVLGQRRTRAGRRSHSCVPERWYVSHF